MAAVITENQVEQVAIDEFTELGYGYLNGIDISPGGLSPVREYHEVVLKGRLEQAIAAINPDVAVEARE